MKYVNFGNDGLKVSRFGLGCMRFPRMKTASGKSIIDEDATIEMVRYAIDHGVNYVDTAYVYPGSEVVLGKALANGYRDRVILSTKQPTMNLKNDKAEQQVRFEEQLERLQTDRFDVYFLHNLAIKSFETTQRLESFAYVSKLKEQGLVKYIAASVHGNYPHFEKVADAHPWDLFMLQYNYYDRFAQAGEKGIKYIHEKNIPLVIMESNHGGMLAANVPQNVRDAFSDEPNMPDYERSFKWLINQKEPTIILSGANNLEQVKQNIEVFDKYDIGCLSTSQVEEYENARGEWNKLVKVPCTACNYCLPCPHGVNIPGIFDLYNMFAKVKKSENAQVWMYNTLFRDAKADYTQCIACHACEGKCPQTIKIVDKLKEAHDLFISKLG